MDEKTSRIATKSALTAKEAERAIVQNLPPIKRGRYPYCFLLPIMLYCPHSPASPELFLPACLITSPSDAIVVRMRIRVESPFYFYFDANRRVVR